MKMEKLPYPSMAEMAEIVSIIDNAWPQGISIEDLIEQFKKKQKSRENFISFVIRNNGIIISHAGFFTRFIEISGKKEKVGCLAAVTTSPDFRNKGYGSKLVTTIFEGMHEYKIRMIFFQTTIPEFYVKFGAKEIHNQFVISKQERKSPWWDDHAMVFPKSIDLMDYEINLCGAGY